MNVITVHIRNIYLNQEFSQDTGTSFIHIQISAKLWTTDDLEHRFSILAFNCTCIRLSHLSYLLLFNSFRGQSLCIRWEGGSLIYTEEHHD